MIALKILKYDLLQKLIYYLALEQLLDNMAYIFVILASLNLMHQNSEYFIAMSYFGDLYLYLF